ncbi:ribonuclease J [Candidatus Cytomitobacter indipagum]|uniref:Ribonuclease J n=1 Tax=Candidatus Cytomitobacter indipagum TaxID=2601575 RepID=A0A5C0UE19_9PROT|nr:ribonuclease J [Candidatus Cytomitobacter indipagum]QEK37931.1 ribonuclease J [Candidatus Cytomitobacter indipagum]
MNRNNNNFRKNNNFRNKIVQSKENTSFDIDNNSLCFVPLGGSGEFGLNLNLYHCNGKWILVDLGMSFEDLPGSNIILPDISFIKTLNHEDILGLVITHGHEDHIGAIPHLIKELNIPIFANPFTSSLIKKKLVDHGVKATLNTVEMGKEFSLDPFKVKLINVTHSIPESAMVYIKTPLGNIMHTGDWKLDETPVVGDKTDYKSLESAAKDGILVAVSDSTNAMIDTETVSEEAVKKSIEKIIAQLDKNRIAMACFASNVSRIDSCARLAQKYGRKVALVGRSIHKIKESAYEHGYFNNLPDFLTEEEGYRMHKDKILFICTGSQGEPNSGLKRLSENDHAKIKLDKDDTVIIASKTIIGREKEVSEMLNNFAKNNVTVITYSDENPIHASGHPVRDDLKKMYKILKPKFLVPVHGERLQQNAHAALGEGMGIKSAVVKNGDVLRIDLGGMRIIHNFHVSKSVLDGKGIVPYNGQTMSERYWLENGCVFVSVLIGSKGYFKLITTFSGICEQFDPLKENIKESIRKVIAGLDQEDRKVQKKLAGTIRKAIKYTMFDLRGKDPAVFVHSTILDKRPPVSINKEGREVRGNNNSKENRNIKEDKDMQIDIVEERESDTLD